MHTPRGTPYHMLRSLALHGATPTEADCRLTERQGRMEHAMAHRELAALTLLVARALWSARRNFLNS